MELIMNTTKIIAVAATLAVNVILAAAVVNLFAGDKTYDVQVAKVETITVTAKRA
jgi:hypothetical protein